MPKKVNETEVEKLREELNELRKKAEKPVDKKEEKEKWSVAEIPTQVTPTIINNETGEPIDLNSVLAKILNNQEKLLKAI